MAITRFIRNGNRVTVVRDGNVYSATVDSHNNVTSVTSMGNGSGNFKTFTRDRHANLYAEVQAEVEAQHHKAVMALINGGE